MRVPPPFILLPLLACARTTNAAKADVPAGGLLITEERIARSGGKTAWQVLQREAPMLALRENRNGQPASMGRRGRSSIYLDDAPVLVLDGIRVGDWRALDQIPATQILSILILTGIDGTTYYGTNATSGVIVIRTKGGPQS